VIELHRDAGRAVALVNGGAGRGEADRERPGVGIGDAQRGGGRAQRSAACGAQGDGEALGIKSLSQNRCRPVSDPGAGKMKKGFEVCELFLPANE